MNISISATDLWIHLDGSQPVDREEKRGRDVESHQSKNQLVFGFCFCQHNHRHFHEYYHHRQ